MKDTLQHIVTSIVENPEQVTITEEEENGLIHLTIAVAKTDMGKVIGKNGKVIKAIRNTMKIPAMKQSKKVSITLADEQ